MVHTLVAVRSKKVPTILHILSIPTNFHNSPLFPPCTAPSPSFMNTLGTLGSRPRHQVGYFLGRRQNWVKPFRFGFVSDCNVAVQCQLSMFVHCICSSPVLSTCSRKVERACREFSCAENERDLQFQRGAKRKEWTKVFQRIYRLDKRSVSQDTISICSILTVLASLKCCNYEHFWG